MADIKYSVVIATYKRAADLRDTLASLASLRPDGPWEVIVVDNNSPDDTRQVVEEASPTFPVHLRYLFEQQQGRSPALNAGIRAARGAIIVTTDDDVRVPPDWLNRAAEGLEPKVPVIERSDPRNVPYEKNDAADADHGIPRCEDCRGAFPYTTAKHAEKLFP